VPKRHRSRLLQRTERENDLACMRIVDPETGRSCVEKRRVRYNEPGQPRELTFSCHRHDAFLSRDRTRPESCQSLVLPAHQGFHAAVLVLLNRKDQPLVL
jgi:hypothetical protein